VTERCVKFFNLKSMRPKERERWQEIRGRFSDVFPHCFAKVTNYHTWRSFFISLKKKKWKMVIVLKCFLKNKKRKVK
jgi:hypothetical protein